MTAHEPQAEPVAWIVFGAEDGDAEAIQFAAASKQEAHDHINDQIAEGVIDAGSWVVRPVYAAPQPQAIDPSWSLQVWLLSLAMKEDSDARVGTGGDT